MMNGFSFLPIPLLCMSGFGFAHAALLGGEWAGWMCSFSAKTGALQPVPDALVPKASLEWGQIPNGFESLASEALMQSSSTVNVVKRRSVKVMPEDGCMAENVGAEICEKELRAVSPGVEGAALAAAIDLRDSSGTWELETVIGSAMSSPCLRRSALPSDADRTRVSLSFEPLAGVLSPGRSLVQVWQERRWAAARELELTVQGERIGLDAAWVSSAVGVPCFGDKLLRTASGEEGTSLRLPCGVDVRCGVGWIELQLHQTHEDDGADGDTAETTLTVLRKYDADGDLEDLSMRSG
mmetsp:Transcript_48388/g.104855  ORF Transcript_48388/g.104855 Transcript_48388/m.104855 type:complete len:296 (-) Transcript_48388:207-1094(-)